MQEWKTIRKKPCTIGSSRGFIIPKKIIKLESGQEYIIKIIKIDSHYAMPTSDYNIHQPKCIIKQKKEQEKKQEEKKNGIDLKYRKFRAIFGARR